ncbi:MAG TPA: hypothetical protein PLI27_06645 [Ignavibacteriales bacterium]|mgnify:FL=1|nr:hypothetical protein [Ignavibacteriales bacterium]HOL81376.1 hypothetical protein [Ignavibacteriales bacterium]HOM65491.1 hypothetical protein [Ignavibacteriales bacterium]HPD67736.1 hypothetical protein [Ignavibacteriales bacterium]HPP33855.1 hypothetical protein [Ignavibacteriales bacterium]
MKHIKILLQSLLLVAFISCSNVENKKSSLPANYDFIDEKSFENVIVVGYNKKENNIIKSYIELYDKNMHNLIFKGRVNEFEINPKFCYVLNDKYFYYDSGYFYLGSGGGDIYGSIVDVKQLNEYKIHIKIGFNNIVYTDNFLTNEIVNSILNKYDIENYKRLDIKYDEDN